MSRGVVRTDLHNGLSLWTRSARQAPRARSRRLRKSLDADVAVVGAGITGAIVALWLVENGHDVTVIDRGAPARGSTLASTAMIQFEIDKPLTKLAKQIGSKNALRAYRRSLRAVQDLGRLIKRHEIDANWVDRRALFLAGNDTGWRGLKTEAAARHKAGLPSIYLTQSELAEQFGITATGAIYSEASAELDPVRTALGCLHAAQRLGATIVSPCEVSEFSTQGGQVDLHTAKGVVSCRRVVFATGYEVVKGVPRDAFEIVSTWALATKPVSASSLWRDRCLIWEASDPYLYLRTTVDNRILVGGEDTGLIDPERRASATATKAKTLLRKVQRLLGRDDLEIDYAWAGAFAESPTGLPVFRELSGMPNTFAILGAGGNGITFGMIGAQIVDRWLSGNTDPDANLFQG